MNMAMTLNVIKPKTLAEILPPAACYRGDADVQITGISADSRNVAAGDLFVARTGAHVRGSRFIEDACGHGAAAILSNDPDAQPCTKDSTIAFLPSLDQELSAIAGRFYDLPSTRLAVTGVTGTNGKTSCCYWYAWLSNCLGTPCGQIGTLGAGYKKGAEQQLESTGMTTPDAIKVQSLLAEASDAGASEVVMEVSSHGLDQGRVADVHFESAIFTNLTQDHLDYHLDMDSYFAAKAKLFVRPGLKRAILNKDDANFDTLAGLLPSETALYSYSLTSDSADLYLSDVDWSDLGAKVTLAGRWGSVTALTPIIGEYNLANMLAVLAALLSAGADLTELAAALPGLPPVPGRMQLISREGCPRIVVDYAHTPDAVASALKAIRPRVQGKLICVLGCGGDRDQAKRPMMGKIASTCADECWFTSDNPRSEDPQSILNDMVSGLSRGNVQLEVDRKRAIECAVQRASKDDLILLLGKGHENYQEILGTRYPYSDVAFSEQVLTNLNESGGNK